MNQNEYIEGLKKCKTHISFIIPVYNTNSIMLERCIKSVLNLGCNDIEIVIINDGSTEIETINVLKAFSKYNNIIVINKDNEGPAIARNVGIESSNGEYIVFLDSDDMIETNRFKKVLQILKKYPDTDVLFHSFDIIDENNSIVKIGYNTNDILSFSCLSSNKNILKKTIDCLGFDNAVIWSKIYKKTAISNVRFDSQLKYCEDNIFNISLTKNCNKFLGIYINAYIHTINPQSLCHKYNPNASKDFSVTIEKMKEQLETSSDINQFYRIVVFHFYVRHVLALQVFNKQNKSNFIFCCKQAKEILYSESYKQAFNNIKLTGLSVREKVVYKLLKRRLFWVAYKVYFFHLQKR